MLEKTEISNRRVRIRVISSELIREHLESSCNGCGVLKIAENSPILVFGGKMLSKCQKIVCSSTLFGVTSKLVVELEV